MILDRLRDNYHMVQRLELEVDVVVNEEQGETQWEVVRLCNHQGIF